jgi:hypothetical protein
MADQDVDFLNVITGDETWYFLYEPQSTCHSCGGKSKSFPEKQKFCLDKRKGKVMLEVFLDAQGLIHYEFIPGCHTVKK